MEISSFRRDLPLLDAMPVPFWEVSIAREMRRFRTPLGLSPNVAGLPSVDLAAAIIFGRRSFEAVLREWLGAAGFRNLRNYALGSVKRPRALGSVLAKCGGSQELLDELAAILRGSGGSGLVRLVHAVEGALYRLMSFVRSMPALCPCCGASLVQSSEDWWSAQPCDVGTPEARLIDRACMVAIATHLLIGLRKDAEHIPLPALQPRSEHPNANWLRTIARLVGAPTLSHLPARVAADVTTDTILRIARGDMLTPEVAAQLLPHIRGGSALEAALIPTRSLAFAIDFLCAANRNSELHEGAGREIVAARIDTLIAELLCVMRTSANEGPVASAVRVG